MDVGMLIDKGLTHTGLWEGHCLLPEIQQRNGASQCIDVCILVMVWMRRTKEGSTTNAYACQWEQQTIWRGLTKNSKILKHINSRKFTHIRMGEVNQEHIHENIASTRMNYYHPAPIKEEHVLRPPLGH